MRRTHRALFFGAVLGFVLVASALPASARHEADPRTKNLHPMGDTDDTRPVETFNEAFFTDIAFWGKVAYQGTWVGGFRTINIAPKGKPKVLAEVDCGVEQGDMGVYGDLVFRSVDFPVAATTPAETCTKEFAESGFEGIQIFRVDNPRNASAGDLVTAVATDCGSHTHTVVPDPRNGRVLIYSSNSSPGPLYPRDPVWGHQCSEPHDKFQIVEVPLDAPEDAAVIADVPLGLGTSHHASCHDIGALMNGDAQLAVCAAGRAVLFDISNPASPVRVRDFGIEGIEPWHSAALSWDGSVAVMGWEPGGGIFPRCLPTGAPLAAFDEPGVQTDDMKSIFFFNTTSGSLLGKWTLPRPQTPLENCTIHNYNVVPTAKRDVLVAGNYQAGTWVVEFTNPAAPRTVAWSDPPAIPCCTDTLEEFGIPLSLGGAWGSYWYNGFIYETNITEGLNVFRLSSRVTAGARKQPFLNPQTQIGPVG
jgi:hypothetical protein